MPLMLSRLKGQLSSDLLMYPVQLPLLAIEIEVDEANKKLQISEHKLNDLEESLGRHDSVGRPKGNHLVMGLLKETTQLSHISQRVSVDGMRVGVVLVGLKVLAAGARMITMRKARKTKTSSRIRS